MSLHKAPLVGRPEPMGAQADAGAVSSGGWGSGWGGLMAAQADVGAMSGAGWAGTMALWQYGSPMPVFPWG